MLEHKLSLLLSREEIARGLERLAEAIKRDYQGQRPFLVEILKGSFVFMADLIREINMPLTVDFVRIQSYASTSSTGEVTISPEDPLPVKGRHVLVVEDMVDTGLTLSCLLGQLEKETPASLKLRALLDKPSQRLVPVQIDYLGFTVPDLFVVGYGMDLDQQYRYLPDLYTI